MWYSPYGRRNAKEDGSMIDSVSHAFIWVLDLDEARDFYVDRLGLQVRTDSRMDGGFRWLTVGPAGQPDLELGLIVPGPPMMDEASATQMKALIAKGAVGGLIFDTPDCRGDYERLRERGV